MAAFACFSSTKEKSTDAYKSLIQRFRQLARSELAQETSISSGASYAFYQEHRDKKTHNYKDFVYQLRKTNLSFVCISMSENPSPQFKHYVRLVENAKLQDGVAANAYYGDIKKIITAYVNYFTHIIDDTIKRIDKYKYFCSNDNLMKLINQTITMFIDNQQSFADEFLPIESEREQAMFDEIKENYITYIEELRVLRESLVHMTKRERMIEFVNEHFQLSLKKINKLCTITHTYISLMLAERIYEIAISVAETVDRLNFNMANYNAKCANKMNGLISTLYDKNKENLCINRRDRKRSVDAAEINRTIEDIKDKIEHYGNEETLARLEIETRFWAKRLRDCNEITRSLMNIRNELDKIEVEEENIKNLMTTELPGPKIGCFETMIANFMKRKKYLEEKWVEMAKTLITFFCCRGTDRILYTDNVGSYYCDEFNHQNYIADYGLKFFHVNCDGDFLENLEADPYFFDENGRFVLDENKQKIHQCAPCTSMYKLGLDGLFKKITKDCGHSEKVNENCRLEIKDLTDVEILPKSDIIDISRSLDHETVNYLWDSFGLILPEVLYDIQAVQPKNPIHFLGHILLKHRYEATKTDLSTLKKLADKYRANIYKDRKEKAAAASRAWKSKLVKRRKPEESDDTLEWAAYNQQVADWQFVNSLGYYHHMY